MSLLELPQPPNWRRGRRHLALIGAACFAGMAYWIFSGVMAAIRGSYLTAYVVMSVAAAPILMAVAVALAVNGRVRVRTTSDATGFTLWPDKLFQVLGYVAFALTAPGGVLGAILLWRGEFDLPMPRGMQLTYMAAAFAALVVIAVRALLAGVRRGGVGYVKLTPAMIESANALKTRAVEWDDVVSVSDSSGEKDFRRAAILHLKDGTEEAILGLDFYVPKGGSLYWMVRHYWKHPEDRMELVDNRAAERLRAGRFDLT
ncbi:hypothetical protein [Mycolicibacterium tusciae]|uniref:hypothetical protein n=1 Tax=Mycolicibacterium tusciae TaxID=75922 RepID=UPI00024A3691|nr:hypothetical protein [Mycolicibacterium tusciae]